jgi:lipopolysaccharide/colanic/teichoic acid biosynthesis glycosyltransferase
MSKRIFDVVVSVVVLVLTAPLSFAAAIAILLSSPGPLIFRQQRVGLHGRTFDILKFRTMRPAQPGASEITVGEDNRIVPIGRTLRKWKIDELPQLVNVLRGEMSLVGPRPEVPSYVALYPAEARSLIQSVRPGITDRASIKYRNESAILANQPDSLAYYRDVILPDKLALGIEYARRASLIEDIRIILSTARSLLDGK